MTKNVISRNPLTTPVQESFTSENLNPIGNFVAEKAISARKIVQKVKIEMAALLKLPQTLIEPYNKAEEISERSQLQQEEIIALKKKMENHDEDVNQNAQ